jgi:hypothetical protein
MGASGNKLKQATPKRRHDSASQSLLKTIVLGLEDYCPAAIAALMSRDEAGRAAMRVRDDIAWAGVSP